MSTQINRSITRLTDTSFNAILGNLELMNGITTVVNSAGQIADLRVQNQADSEIQTLLAAIRTILNNNVARGYAVIQTTLGSEPIGDLVKYIYKLKYFNSISTQADITLYEVDLKYFYAATNTSATAGTYDVATNATFTGTGSSDSIFISELGALITQVKQLIDLNSDIAISFE